MSIPMITQIRQSNPSLKVIGCSIDSWFLTETLITTAPYLDLIWTSVDASIPVWNHPALANKVLKAPLPIAGNEKRPDIPLIPNMLFIGTAMQSLTRMLWLATASHLGLPVQTRTSSQYVDDGLPAVESYSRYAQSYYESTCVINFTVRDYPPPTHYVNWRTFEGILCGALLVQEAGPDTYHYFIPGEHYLEFSTLSELTAIARFITDNRDEAEEVRRRGNDFARAHYSDEKLIGYIDKWLYFPDN